VGLSRPVSLRNFLQLHDKLTAQRRYCMRREYATASAALEAGLVRKPQMLVVTTLH